MDDDEPEAGDGDMDDDKPEAGNGENGEFEGDEEEDK